MDHNQQEELQLYKGMVLFEVLSKSDKDSRLDWSRFTVYQTSRSTRMVNWSVMQRGGYVPPLPV